MWQVEWRIEHVEGTVPHLHIAHLRSLELILFVHYDECASVRRGAERIVHQASVEHLVRRQQIGDLANMGAGWSVHAAPSGAEPGCVRQNCRLHRELSSICERCNPSWIQVIFERKSLLCLRSTIMIHHAFEVTRCHWTKTRRTEVAQQCHRYSRFFAIGMCDHDAC